MSITQGCGIKIHGLWLMGLWVLVSCAPSSTLRVACVGDSITFGDVLADPERQSYPAQLQTMLGDSFEVRNFGRNGRTLLKAGHAPYWHEEALAKAMALAPQVVVIMLGTNDSKPINWQYAQQFERDYLALIDTFLRLPSQPEVMVCLPPPVYQNGFEIRDHTLTREIVPAIRRVAQQRPVRLIDLPAAMSQKPYWFIDGVHPTAVGAAEIAQQVAMAIRGVGRLVKKVESQSSRLKELKVKG
jgi:acyl-CoA thioesterase I